MKKITLLLLIFVLTFTFSCSSDDEDTPETTYKLVKIEYFDSNNSLDTKFTIEYNNDGLISKTISTNNNGEVYTTDYIYNNGKVTSLDYGGGESNSFIYTDNLITSSVLIEGGFTYNTTYMYNANNQVIREVESEQGSTSEYEITYTYDNNNNVLSKTYDNSYGNTYTYDSKKNPLQLVFNEAMLKIYTNGQNNALTSTPDVVYTYEYDDNDYPTRQNYYVDDILEQYTVYTYEEI